MPKVTVYIRNEDIDEWRSIGAKTTFVHNALKIVRGGGLEALGLIVDDRTRTTNIDKPLARSTSSITKTPQQVTNILKDRLIKDGLVCKLHGIPLDSRGKCLQKGCKYS